MQTIENAINKDESWQHGYAMHHHHGTQQKYLFFYPINLVHRFKLCVELISMTFGEI